MEAFDVDTTSMKNRIGERRKDFPILQRQMNGKPLVFLDSAASSQKPDVVTSAIKSYYDKTHANVHRGVYQLSQEATDAFEKSRATIQSFINAKHSHEVIFVRGCTEGINLVASSYGDAFIREGDEVIITTLEHHSNIVPWQMVCEKKGANLKVVHVDEAGEIDLDDYKSKLSSKVKMVAVNHISNTLGTINPVKQMIDMAHELDIPVLVDGAQATPHMKIDVQALDADFYVFSGHKMYGPTGIGVLYGKEHWLNKMPPYHGGGEMIKTVTFEKTTYNELPFKFEAGTPNIADSIGLAAAVDYIGEIGLDVISEHENDLLNYGTDLLSSIEGMRFIGTAKAKAGVISFLVGDIHPYDIGTLLDKQGIAVRTGHHCTQPLMDHYGIPGTVRASFGLYNNMEDLDRLYEALTRAVNILS